jgi:histidinol-phosphate phosphatase family protein
MTSFIKKIDKSWSLFLDRDGVINKRLPDDYVKTSDEFEFLPGTLDAIALFTKLFNKIVIVTNQQGIGKGLMSKEQLEDIHKNMIKDIENNNGHIDNVYYCPDLEGSASFHRKPSIGMGLKAKKDFKEINFKKSIIIGDSISDMKFGKKLGMKTVFIDDNNSKALAYPELIDIISSSLIDFAKTLNNTN